MDFRLDMTMMFALQRAVEDTPMVGRPIAAGPYLVLTFQPGHPPGSPTGPGQSGGLTIGEQAGSAAVARGGRSRPVSLLRFRRPGDADARAAVTVLRRLADLIEDAAAPEVSGNVFRREGEYWTVCYGGSLARLGDAKGLRYLARLLADPGREFHAVDLEAADRQAPGPALSAARGQARADGLRMRPDLVMLASCWMPGPRPPTKPGWAN
jgi:hypothetical protein